MFEPAVITLKLERGGVGGGGGSSLPAWCTWIQVDWSICGWEFLSFGGHMGQTGHEDWPMGGSMGVLRMSLGVLVDI